MYLHTYIYIYIKRYIGVYTPFCELAARKTKKPNIPNIANAARTGLLWRNKTNFGNIEKKPFRKTKKPNISNITNAAKTGLLWRNFKKHWKHLKKKSIIA